MSSAARAEARRKAILARGGDRLAKLTTSARGDEYLNDARAFVGDETPPPLPQPPLPPPKDTPRPSPSPPRPDWPPSFTQLPPPYAQTDPNADDPIANMMAQLANFKAAQADAGKTPAPSVPTIPPTPLQKWLPLLHLVCMWTLLAVFVLWQEPRAFADATASAVEVPSWRRWQQLLLRPDGGWAVQAVPFFWAFMTLQVMMHSLRIFAGHNDVQPPALLSLALPHLPSPLPSLIINSLRYLRMGNVFMDDMAAVVFGIGVIVMITSCFVD